MGAHRFVPPKVVIRWVVPTPTDPVVVARGGVAAIEQAKRDGFHVVCALGHRATGGTSTLPRDFIEAGEALLAISAERARLRVADGELSKALAAQRRAARKTEAA